MSGTLTRIEPEDLEGAERFPTLGPVYYAARRLSEQAMAGVEAEPFKAAIDAATEKVREALYTYAEDFIRGDMELNIAGHVRSLVEDTVEALLTGNEWAMQQYPFADYRRGEEIRAAVATHGGEPLLMKRIADLEREIERLRESLKWARQ